MGHRENIDDAHLLLMEHHNIPHDGNHKMGFKKVGPYFVAELLGPGELVFHRAKYINNLVSNIHIKINDHTSKSCLFKGTFFACFFSLFYILLFYSFC